MLSNPFTLSSYLNVLDVSVLVGFFIGCLLIIAYSYRRSHKQKDTFDWLDYLLMGRQLSLPLFVGSLVATWYGGIFGVTRIAFESGLYNFLIQGIFWYISYILFAVFLVDKAYPSGSISLAEWIGSAFGRRSRKLAAVFNFFNVVPAVYSISLGLLLQALSGFSFAMSMAIALGFVFITTSLGGFRAVVLTDLLQMLAMFLGVGSVFFFALYQWGGWDFLQTHLPDGHMHVLGQHSLGETLAWGFIALSTLVDPNFYQRIFAAKSATTAKKGIWIATGFWFIFDIFTTFGAMYARALMPEAAAENAYLYFAVQILPQGLRGLFLAGLIACILSTLDSYVFTASNTLLYDLLPGKLYQKRLFHSMAHLFVCTLSFALALGFSGNIKNIWKSLGSLSAACLLVPVLLQIGLRRKISDRQFVWVCCLSAVAVVLWRNYRPLYGLWLHFDELYLGIIVTGLGFLLAYFYNQRPNFLLPVK